MTPSILAAEGNVAVTMNEEIKTAITTAVNAIKTVITTVFNA